MNKVYKPSPLSVALLIAFWTLASGSFLTSCTSGEKLRGNPNKIAAPSLEEANRARELQDEINIGREVAAKLFGTFGDLNEKKLSVEYLNLIAQSLAAKAGRPEIIYKVGILDTTEINAFAMPGGYILITKGLLEKVENEQELAGVIAHEMGHINHRHLFKEVAPKRDVSTGETLSRFLSRGGANVSFAIGQAVSKGIKTLLDEGLKPELEYEADQSGIEYTWATGYDPRHFKNFMERLAKSQTMDTKKLLKTHPSFEDRMQKMSTQLAQLQLTDSPPSIINKAMITRFLVLKDQIQKH